MLCCEHTPSLGQLLGKQQTRYSDISIPISAKIIHLEHATNTERLKGK